MDKEKKQKLILGIMIGLGAIGFLWLNIIQPIFDEQDTLSMNQTKLEGEKRRLLMKIRKKNMAEIDLNDAQKELKRQSKFYIPEANGVFRVKELVREMCEEAKLSKDSYTFDTDDEKFKNSTTNMIPVSLKLRCGYHTVGKFIEHMEKTSPFALISSLEMKRNSENNNVESILTFTLPLMNSKLEELLKEVNDEN